MMHIGKFSYLTATRRTDNGVYVTDKEETREALLPNKFVPDELEPGDIIRVFLFTDSEDRLTATTIEPTIKLHEFAYLEVKEVNNYGAFLDWGKGMEKDILVPFAEQMDPMKPGQRHIVFMYLDEKTERLVATARYSRYFDNENIKLRPGEMVNLLVDDAADLGVNVIVNNRYRGLIYHNEIFQPLHRGKQLKGYVKNIREDNKLDIMLQKPGLSNIEANAAKIMTLLRSNQGYLNMTDNSTPEDIYDRLEMSKKTFKKSVGALYKMRLIRLENDGIYLNS